MFSFLQGRPYRLILFGGREEISVDDVTRYRNTGQWTDYYFAFQKARHVMAEHPQDTEFRMVLVTDAILDPSPEDWADMSVPPGEDLRAHVAGRTVALLREMAVPLYVILVGDVPAAAVKGRPERAPGLILEMTQAANGARATPLAQTVASFLNDDGVLLKRYVFRVQSSEGLAAIKPVVTRIVAPASAAVETGLFAGLLLPLVLFLFLLIGVLVREFPGPGDVEVLELPIAAPVNVAVDRLHREEGGGWSKVGLSLVADPRDAAATFSLRPPEIDLTGAGVDLSAADAETRALLPLSPDELRRTIEDRAKGGTKQQKIFDLNLDYMAKALVPAEAERILRAPAADRHHIPAIEFLRAKARLLSDDALRHALLDPHVHVVTYGRAGERKDLGPGDAVRIGPYSFVVQEIARGGRKDVRLVLRYKRIPSVLGLKNWLPRRLQQAARFRRRSQRMVS
jgi:hypothetical protein